MAAPTILRNGDIIEINTITEDVEPEQILLGPETKYGAKIKRIEFIGGAAKDKVVIRCGSDSGPKFCQLGVTDASISTIIVWSDGSSQVKPFVDFSECTLNAGHSLIIELG